MSTRRDPPHQHSNTADTSTTAAATAADATGETTAEGTQGHEVSGGSSQKSTSKLHSLSGPQGALVSYPASQVCGA